MGPGEGIIACAWWLERELHVAVDVTDARRDLCNVGFGGENLEPAGLQSERCDGRVFKRTGHQSGGHDRQPPRTCLHKAGAAGVWSDAYGVSDDQLPSDPTRTTA
jgi:hypothetical protein